MCRSDIAGQLVGSVTAAAWASFHSSSSYSSSSVGKPQKAPPLTPLLVSAILLEAAGRLAAHMQSSESLGHLTLQQKKAGQQTEALQQKKTGQQAEATLPATNPCAELTMQQKKAGRHLQSAQNKEVMHDKSAFTQQQVTVCTFYFAWLA